MPKFPFVIVRTMSNTFSTPIAIVVRTTTRVPRIIGIVTRLNRRQPVAPSSSAASMTSPGIALIAAERTTMAKPTWIQIMMTMSRKLLSGCVSNQFGGSSTPSQIAIWLSKPICGPAGSRYS